MGLKDLETTDPILLAPIYAHIFLEIREVFFASFSKPR